MSTMNEPQGAGMAPSATPEAAPPDPSIPEPVGTFLFALILLLVGLLIAVVLGFIGFSDLMPRLSPSPPTTFH